MTPTIELVREVDDEVETLEIDVHDYEGLKIRAVAYAAGPMPSLFDMTPVKGGKAGIQKTFDAVVAKFRKQGFAEKLDDASANRVTRKKQKAASAVAKRAAELAAAVAAWPSTKLDKALAAAIAKPGAVKKLELVGNGKNVVTFVPPTIAKLTKLEVLRLDNNKLLALPDEIEKLTKLRELYLANNRIQSLPGELRSLKNLAHLDVRNNELKRINFRPKVVATLNVEGNALAPAVQYLLTRSMLGDHMKVRTFSVDTDILLPIDLDYLEHDYPRRTSLPVTSITLHGRKPTPAESKTIAKLFPKATVTLA